MAPARADQIVLFNTGVSTAGTQLSNGQIDPHYTLTSRPDAVPTPDTTKVLTSAGGFPIPPWLGDTTTSRWLVPGTSDDDGNAPLGNYTFQTTFTLPAFSSASITGQWALDNSGISIAINGTPIPGTSVPESRPGPGGTTIFPFQEFTPFSVTSGFQTGLNTLAFTVFNGFPGFEPGPLACAWN